MYRMWKYRRVILLNIYRVAEKRMFNFNALRVPNGLPIYYCVLLVIFLNGIAVESS